VLLLHDGSLFLFLSSGEVDDRLPSPGTLPSLNSSRSVQLPGKKYQRPVFPCPQRSLFVPVRDLSRLVSLLAPLVVLLV
jgi:hypothetical protein